MRWSVLMKYLLTLFENKCTPTQMVYDLHPPITGLEKEGCDVLDKIKDRITRGRKRSQMNDKKISCEPEKKKKAMI